MPWIFSVDNIQDFRNQETFNAAKGADKVLEQFKSFEGSSDVHNEVSKNIIAGFDEQSNTVNEQIKKDRLNS